MNNQDALKTISRCSEELENIKMMIEKFLGATSPIVPFLTKYAIIKACGTIEYSFKTIIADLHNGNTPQVTNYIDETIRHSSMNPSVSNMCKVLNKFDANWKNSFKHKLNNLEKSQRIKSSLDSINNARNSFAHGGSPTSTFENIASYFEDTIRIIEILDEVVNN